MKTNENGTDWQAETWMGSPKGEYRKLGSDGIDGTAARVAVTERE
jgi:hypothetical protein